MNSAFPVASVCSRPKMESRGHKNETRSGVFNGGIQTFDLARCKSVNIIASKAVTNAFLVIKIKQNPNNKDEFIASANGKTSLPCKELLIGGDVSKIERTRNHKFRKAVVTSKQYFISFQNGELIIKDFEVKSDQKSDFSEIIIKQKPRISTLNGNSLKPQKSNEELYRTRHPNSKLFKYDSAEKKE